jgi:hypothetical protein
LTCLGGLFPGAADTRAQPALGRYDGKTLLLRTFAIPSAPAAGGKPFAPKVEPSEVQLSFRPQDLRVYRLDGRAVERDAWRKALAKETAVRFIGYALKGPDEPAAADPKIELPTHERKAYRDDLLIVFGVRQPAAQKPVRPGDHFPKGAAPRYGVASLATGGRLRVTDSSTSRAHYPAREADAAQAENHIFTTTVITVTVDLRLRDAGLAFSDGRKVTDEAVAEVLAREAPVVISADGGPVDPLFLRLIRPNTIVVTIPQRSAAPNKSCRKVPPHLHNQATVSTINPARQ